MDIDQLNQFKFGFTKFIHCLSLKYSQFSLGFLWIGRIKSKFNFDMKPYVKSKLVSEGCPTCCPYCDVSNSIPNFTHSILLYPKFKEFVQ